MFNLPEYSGHPCSATLDAVRCGWCYGSSRPYLCKHVCDYNTVVCCRSSLLVVADQHAISVAASAVIFAFGVPLEVCGEWLYFLVYLQIWSTHRLWMHMWNFCDTFVGLIVHMQICYLGRAPSKLESCIFTHWQTGEVLFSSPCVVFFPLLCFFCPQTILYGVLFSFINYLKVINKS